MKSLILALSISLAILPACGQFEQAKKAGAAIAEKNCLLLSAEDSVTPSDEEINAVLQSYGFENQDALDEYLSGIKGTTEMNEVSVSIRDNLQEKCGDKLKELNLTPEDIYQDFLPK